MKKQIMTLVAVMAMATATCMAQGECPEGKSGPQGCDMISQMKTELSLSDDQATKLQEVFQQMRPGKPGECPSEKKDCCKKDSEKKDCCKKDSTKKEKPSKKERPSNDEMKKQREEMDAKVKAILTDEQYTKFQKMQSQRRPPRDGKCPGQQNNDQK